MEADDLAKLLEDLDAELLRGARSLAVLGLTPTALAVAAHLQTIGFSSVAAQIYVPSDEQHRLETPLSIPVRPVSTMLETQHDVVLVAADAEKEDLIRAALPYLQGNPRLLVAGYGHHRYRNRVFHEELSQLLVPSLANGYPESLVHIFQCLENAARRGIGGVVAEFGMFKGGTTMFLSRSIARLGVNWPVIGFDTFAGFPSRRSPLDMYDHPDCAFTDLDAVKRYLGGRSVEIVPGDIVDTCHRLDNEDVVLAFIDTDNYTPAKAAIDVLRERTAVGGAIVFDHLTGRDRFRYTLGERMAAQALFDDHRYFNLHGTGVFFRQI